ncbi:nicotinate-nucleotide--dimethylbenzimidazole phosphoribosyltransferase [Paenibacillus guangzhouensis]|uniref:nicotinate-nucleotide--dimethylbenzimidazole phosphoribosyltransferase n=1 Tax=Paenibacillus guangzhouensis TaxID=1473112 RepID=UPI00187B303F|nr:nicotinate-nucleotide--dimethylbenzimidazole phosphoribosyltransferase [Paenibacillus guangzhouensis]
MKERLEQLIAHIEPLDGQLVEDALQHLDQLTKPPGSLGKLEQIAAQVAGITGELHPAFAKKAVIVMAGDHGVCEEGISAFPAEVTPQMVYNFLNGGAAVNVLARHAGADVICVDIGVNADLAHPQLVSRKVRKGTANMAKGPAMTQDEAIQAILTGAEIVEAYVAKGYSIFATGEMGIGNTTASAAILSVLTGMSSEETVGRGTGIDDERMLHKQAVVRQAIQVNRPNAKDALDVLAKVGGLEIAGLVGVILGAARHQCPVVIDGFISSAAALIASRIEPLASGYMIGSHLSQEQGHESLLEEIGLTPVLQLDMRLGEGTGAVLAFTLIDAATKIMREMATFASAGISSGEDAAE